jgi:aminopeptidase N
MSNEEKKYNNIDTRTNDLWKELEGVSSKGLDITGIMDTWTRQMGYPVITVRNKIIP